MNALVSESKSNDGASRSAVVGDSDRVRTSDRAVDSSKAQASNQASVRNGISGAPQTRVLRPSQTPIIHQATQSSPILQRDGPADPPPKQDAPAPKPDAPEQPKPPVVQIQPFAQAQLAALHIEPGQVKWFPASVNNFLGGGATLQVNAPLHTGDKGIEVANGVQYVLSSPIKPEKCNNQNPCPLSSVLLFGQILYNRGNGSLSPFVQVGYVLNQTAPVSASGTGPNVQTGFQFADDIVKDRLAYFVQAVTSGTVTLPNATTPHAQFDLGLGAAVGLTLNLDDLGQKSPAKKPDGESHAAMQPGPAREAPPAPAQAAPTVGIGAPPISVSDFPFQGTDIALPQTNLLDSISISISKLLAANPGSYAVLTGYADPTEALEGADKANEIGLKRANTVKTVLGLLGVSDKSIRVASGTTDPLKAAADPRFKSGGASQSSLIRRVEISFTK